VGIAVFSNGHRYSCTIIIISSEEMRISVHKWGINVQECTRMYNNCTEKGYFFGFPFLLLNIYYIYYFYRAHVSAREKIII
jgi:hypothetical protein